MSFLSLNSMSPHQLDEAKDQGLARGRGTKLCRHVDQAAGVYSMAIEAKVSISVVTGTDTDMASRI